MAQRASSLEVAGPPSPLTPPVSPDTEKAVPPSFLIPAIHAPMTARNAHEANRGSTPIELLFDLTIVIGVSVVAEQFAAELIRGSSIGVTVFKFLFTSMALWLAWLPFVWFCSGYYVDDALFRIGTLGQMAGLLVISNGIAVFFTDNLNSTEVIIGYVIARVFYIVFFRLRAALQNPSRRYSNLKHAGFTFVLQVLWLARLALPSGLHWTLGVGVVVGTLEFLAPLLAESGNGHETPFHPHHIADRYAELTVIIFGEGIASISSATRNALQGESLNLESIRVALAGLLILFSLWWMYFLVPFGALLHKRPQASFIWGYMHFFIHTPLILVAASLAMCAKISGDISSELTPDSPSLENLESEALLLAAIGISIYLQTLNFLTQYLSGFLLRNFFAKTITCAVVLLMAFFVPGAMTVGWALLCLCLPLACLLSFTMFQTGIFECDMKETNTSVVESE
ncbi:hypothetical protein HDU98_011567 [Podochytrium sp. JEL0797]|nr:hypothetical protein HDU98_011567 [Podochytrium sp. JEL0797]